MLAVVPSGLGTASALPAWGTALRRGPLHPPGPRAPHRLWGAAGTCRLRSPSAARCGGPGAQMAEAAGPGAHMVKAAAGAHLAGEGCEPRPAPRCLLRFQKVHFRPGRARRGGSGAGGSDRPWAGSALARAML